MSGSADDSLLTRRTLLSRLRNLDDQESWRTFFDLYWGLLYNVARKSGLDDLGAQDTVISVAYPATGFNLQQNTNLSTTNWIAPDQNVTHNGMINFIIVDPPSGNRFYRLFKP